MKFKAVIFDCDGTLVDSEAGHFLSYQHALEEHGHSFSAEDYRPFVGKSAVSNTKFFADKYQLRSYESILASKEKKYFELLQKGFLPIRSTIDFALRLAGEKEERELKLGVASAARKEEIMVNLRHLTIDRLFDVVVSGHEDLSEYHDPEGVNKPKPYIYIEAAKRLGVMPTECIAIEDSATGVAAARSAGCITLAVPNVYTVRQDLSQAHFQIGSFDTFSVQDFFMLASSL